MPAISPATLRRVSDKISKANDALGRPCSHIKKMETIDDAIQAIDEALGHSPKSSQATTHAMLESTDSWLYDKNGDNRFVVQPFRTHDEATKCPMILCFSK